MSEVMVASHKGHCSHCLDRPRKSAVGIHSAKYRAAGLDKQQFCQPSWIDHI